MRMDRHQTQQVRHVLIITLVLNLAVALGKIGIGLLTGALAIAADGFHSLMDASSNIVGLVALRLGAQPPDADHPYGHGRYEIVAAAAIGVLLLVTAYEVVTNAIDRLFAPALPESTPLAFIVLIGTLIINLGVSRYERAAGERLRSPILLADAANTGADVFVTLSVLVSVALTAFGLRWADPLAALIVVGLIVRAALHILRTAGSVLVDTAPYSPDDLTQMIALVPCIDRVLRARSRGTTDSAYVDIDVTVAPATTAVEMAAITERIRAAVRQRYPGADEIEVHFEPTRAEMV